MASTGNHKKPLNLSKRQTKKLPRVQAYSRLYYEKRLKPITDARWEQYITENPEMKSKKGERLRHRNVVLKELLDAETDDVKAEVERRREEGIMSGDEDLVESEDDEGDGLDTVEKERRTKASLLQRYLFFRRCFFVIGGDLTGYCRAQNRLRVSIESVLDEVEKETGFIGTVILGGPEPRCGGDLVVMS
jgi:hypothetical protein